MGRKWHDEDFDFKPVETRYESALVDDTSSDTIKEFFGGDYDIAIRTATIDHPRCVIFTAKQQTIKKMPLGMQVLFNKQYRIVFKRRYLYTSKYMLEEQDNRRGWVTISTVSANSPLLDSSIERLMEVLIDKSRVWGRVQDRNSECIF